MALLDVILGYDCNLWCDYCTITTEMRRSALPPAAVVQALRQGRVDGYNDVSFTGGEPTIRPDLIGLVRTASRLGYRSIKVQSNGLVYSQPRNVDKLVEAGVTDFHVSIHSHDPETYDKIVNVEGAHEHMRNGLAALVQRGLKPTADLILKSDTYRQVADAIQWLHDLGVRKAHLWFVSLTDNNRDNLHSMPRMTEVVPYLHKAIDLASTLGVEVRSLHVPRCLLGDRIDRAWDPGAGQVRVVTPEATFDLRDAKLTPRVHVPACEGCEHRDKCPGVRPDYLEVFGDAEIAGARGTPGSVAPTRLSVLR